MKLIRKYFIWAFPEIKYIKKHLTDVKKELADVWIPRRENQNISIPSFQYADGVCSQMYCEITAIEEILSVFEDE